jgi:hypothetical protein
VEKKITITDVLKRKISTIYSKFSFYRKLVRATIKFDKLRWLKSIDDNLKSQPNNSGNTSCLIETINPIFIQLELDGTHLAEPCEVADALAKHFQSVIHTPCSGVFPSLPKSSDFPS